MVVGAGLAPTIPRVLLKWKGLCHFLFSFTKWTQTTQIRFIMVHWNSYKKMLSLPLEKRPIISSRGIVCFLLTTLSNLLPLIIRVNRNAYLKLVLFLLGKYSPGVKNDPLIRSRASSNWKAAFVWTRGFRVKNTMEFFLIWIFHHKWFGKVSEVWKPKTRLTINWVV